MKQDIRSSRITNDPLGSYVKSQDILLVAKLACVHIAHAHEQSADRGALADIPNDWRGWAQDPAFDAENEPSLVSTGQDARPRWTYSGLAEAIGISVSECNAAARRMVNAGLLRLPRGGGHPVPVASATTEFLVHGCRYVFPPVRGTLVRGIPTAAFAPVLAERLSTTSEYSDVWPDGYGKSTGLSLEPLHRSVPLAVRRDPLLYELLALVDSVRLGRARESGVAVSLIEERMAVLR